MSDVDTGVATEACPRVTVKYNELTNSLYQENYKYKSIHTEQRVSSEHTFTFPASQHLQIISQHALILRVLSGNGEIDGVKQGIDQPWPLSPGRYVLETITSKKKREADNPVSISIVYEKPVCACGACVHDVYYKLVSACQGVPDQEQPVLQSEVVPSNEQENTIEHVKWSISAPQLDKFLINTNLFILPLEKRFNSNCTFLSIHHWLSSFYAHERDQYNVVVQYDAVSSTEDLTNFFYPQQLHLLSKTYTKRFITTLLDVLPYIEGNTANPSSQGIPTDVFGQSAGFHLYHGYTNSVRDSQHTLLSAGMRGCPHSCTETCFACFLIQVQDVYRLLPNHEKFPQPKTMLSVESQHRVYGAVLPKDMLFSSEMLSAKEKVMYVPIPAHLFTETFKVGDQGLMEFQKVQGISHCIHVTSGTDNRQLQQTTNLDIPYCTVGIPSYSQDSEIMNREYTRSMQLYHQTEVRVRCRSIYSHCNQPCVQFSNMQTEVDTHQLQNRHLCFVEASVLLCKEGIHLYQLQVSTTKEIRYMLGWYNHGKYLALLVNHQDCGVQGVSTVCCLPSACKRDKKPTWQIRCMDSPIAYTMQHQEQWRREVGRAILFFGLKAGLVDPAAVHDQNWMNSVNSTSLSSFTSGPSDRFFCISRERVQQEVLLDEDVASSYHSRYEPVVNCAFVFQSWIRKQQTRLDAHKVQWYKENQTQLLFLKQKVRVKEADTDPVEDMTNYTVNVERSSQLSSPYHCLGVDVVQDSLASCGIQFHSCSLGSLLVATENPIEDISDGFVLVFNDMVFSPSHLQFPFLCTLCGISYHQDIGSLTESIEHGGGMYNVHSTGEKLETNGERQEKGLYFMVLDILLLGSHLYHVFVMLVTLYAKKMGVAYILSLANPFSVPESQPKTLRRLVPEPQATCQCEPWLLGAQLDAGFSYTQPVAAPRVSVMVFQGFAYTVCGIYLFERILQHVVQDFQLRIVGSGICTLAIAPYVLFTVKMRQWHLVIGLSISLALLTLWFILMW